MKIPIKDLLKIENIENYEVSFNRADPLFTAVFIISGKTLSGPSTVSKISLEELLIKDNSSISILTNAVFRENLKNINPSLFLPVSDKMRMGELLKLAKEYELMNLKSRKKRYIIILEDICSQEAKEIYGGQQLLIEYGTKLTLNIINKFEKRLNPGAEIEYKDSEEGVLVFIPDARDFKLKVDLFAILASLNFEIYDAKDAKEAVQFYASKIPKLVIFGDIEGNLNAKSVFLELEKYDPFIKKLNYKESPASNRQFETTRIKTNYFLGYSQLIELINRKKENLPSEVKNNIIDILDKLRVNYSIQNYIETAYKIKQFGRMFNITSLWNMLENIKSDSSVKK